MRAVRVLVLLLVGLGLCFAVPIHMLKPYNKTVSDGDIIDFGTVAPAQTFSAAFWPVVHTGGISGHGGYYDYVYAVVPSGWSTTPSDVDGKPLFITITPPSNITDGEYSFFIHIIDLGNYENLSNLTLFGRVRISHHILGIVVNKTQKTKEIYGNITYTIVVHNYADAGGVFNITCDNPAFSETFYLPPHGSRTFHISLTSEEEATLVSHVEVKPVFCPSVGQNITLVSHFVPSVTGDVKAVPDGVIIFPYASGIFYMFIGFIGSLAKVLGL